MPISPMLDFPSHACIKKRVKAFWDKGKEKEGIKYKIAHLYEFAAKLYGYENWDTFSAILLLNDKNRKEFLNNKDNQS